MLRYFVSSCPLRVDLYTESRAYFYSNEAKTGHSDLVFDEPRQILEIEYGFLPECTESNLRTGR
jgi:hypothetical protein